MANPTLASRSTSSTRISLLRTPLSTTKRSRANVAEERRASPWSSAVGGGRASKTRAKLCG
ncbi:MAG: hypothetical protein WCP98_22205, partial [Actinomycetes bacterium]